MTRSGEGDGADQVGVRAPDGYEEKFMAGEGTVLHREKAIAPWYFHLLLLVPGLLAIVGGILPLALGAPDSALGLAFAIPLTLLLFLVWLLFSVLRVTVTSEQFHIQYGLFGPKIPISKIKKAESVAYDWKEFGGWGIKRSFKDGAMMYNMLGDKGRAARVTYEDESGKEKTVVVGCSNANLLIDAVRRASARALPEGKKRVADVSSGEQVEVEAETEEDEGAKKRR